jgi:acetyl-CoA C-acetyltransferase
MDPRTPVLVGVGTASEHAEATELMTLALRDAASDAGAPEILEAIDRMAVPQGSWTYPDPARLVAGAVGAREVRTHLVELGIPQQGLINEALSAILDGSSDVAVVVGGEARRWARSADAVETGQPDLVPDVVRRRTGALLESVEVVTRLWDPVQQYAMIDNALRAAEGLSIGEHRREVAELCARFNGVAQGNPLAAFPTPMTAGEIDLASPANRPLAFPYNKWHSTQWTVDQAAALLFCSQQAAHRFGISSDRWIFPRVGIESSHAVSLLRRERPDAWPAMGILGRAASTRIGRPVADAEFIEVYSCFPAAVRVQQRELGLDVHGTPTITGGMAFAGGPFNNFVLQTTAAVARALRAEPGSLGVVTTVSGLLTKPGLGVWSAEPDGQAPLLGDFGAEAERATDTRDVVGTLGEYTGAATVVTYTVTPGGRDGASGPGAPQGPGGAQWARTVVVGDTEDGRRCVAISEDAELAVFATTHELIGRPVVVKDGSFHLG